MIIQIRIWIQSFVDFAVVICTKQSTVFWLKTQLNRLFWTVPEYSVSPGLLLSTAFNASPLSPGAPWGGKVASKRVEKEHYLLKPLRKMLRGHFFPPKWICFICFSQRYCSFCLHTFFPFRPSTHNLTCARTRSSHYFTWQGDVKFWHHSNLSPALSRTFWVDVLGAQTFGSRVLAFNAFGNSHYASFAWDWSVFHRRCCKGDLNYSHIGKSLNFRELFSHRQIV